MFPTISEVSSLSDRRTNEQSDNITPYINIKNILFTSIKRRYNTIQPGNALGFCPALELAIMQEEGSGCKVPKVIVCIL